MMERIPLTDKGDKPFTITDENQTYQVEIIEVMGTGGSGIAYKGIRSCGNSKRACVIKEYFPVIEEGESYKKSVYKREKQGEPLVICSDTKEKYEEEVRRQKENVDREIRMTNELFSDGEENSPYMYSAELLTRWGDSSYILLDTAEGQTLKALQNKRENQKLSLMEAIQYCEKLLVIIQSLLNGEKKYVHGDIKPENIWIAGSKAAEYMCLLDFGSVFRQDEYKCENVDSCSKEEMMELADRVIYNEGIGCSSEGYRSGKIRALWEAKGEYFAFRSEGNARELVKKVNDLDISVEIYSALQVLFYMATGKEFQMSGMFSPYQIEKLTGENEIVCEVLYQIMDKNSWNRYSSIEEVEEDLKNLKEVLKKEASPAVLLQGIKEELQREFSFEIDEKLFGEIE